MRTNINDVSSLIIKSQLSQNFVLSQYSRPLNRTGRLWRNMSIREVLDLYTHRRSCVLGGMVHIEFYTCWSLGLRETSLDVTQVIVMVFVNEFFAPNIKPIALVKLPRLFLKLCYIFAMLIVDFKAVKPFLLKSLSQMIENFDLVGFF